ncbi:MAG: ferredoxin--NADP reductase [bacterium]
MKIIPYNATVTKINLITPDLMILNVKSDEPRIKSSESIFNYIGLGLHVNEERSENSSFPLRPLAKICKYDDYLIKRPYSIVKMNNNNKNFEFYINQIKSGQLSPRLFNLKQESRLWIDNEILNIFSLEQIPENYNIVLIATGTAIAAYISFLHTYLQNNKETKIALIHGAAYPWDLGYFSELRFVENNHDNFYYIPTVLQPDNSWNGLKGYIEQHLENKILENQTGIEINPEKTFFLLCGNPYMVKAVSDFLSKYHYTKHNIKKPGYLHLEN